MALVANEKRKLTFALMVEPSGCGTSYALQIGSPHRSKSTVRPVVVFIPAEPGRRYRGSLALNAHSDRSSRPSLSKAFSAMVAFGEARLVPSTNDGILPTKCCAFSHKEDALAHVRRSSFDHKTRSYRPTEDV